jgi:glycerate 2-kinase
LTNVHPADAQSLLADLYSAATTAVAPGPGLRARLQSLGPDNAANSIWVIALGKAAVPMADAAVEHLRASGRRLAGGLVIGPAVKGSEGSPLPYRQGDHPEPGPASFAAAEALARVVAQISPEAEVWVLLSGGTTSLVGAPEPGLTTEELSGIYALLLGSGLEITAMNRIRKRFSRWGGGKLARALAPARVRVYIVSDVIGDDLASIGSGPCVPDPTTAAEVRHLLESSGLWSRIPASARTIIHSAETGSSPETPKPGDEAFVNVSSEVIASNHLALEAVRNRAAELGMAPLLIEVPIVGEAAAVGTRIASELLGNCNRSAGQPAARCFIWGGETTVTLGDGSAGLGGRCQELALAAARVFNQAGESLALLAAGTDGRDGPTDAAGAIVDAGTWSAIARGGRDPASDLAYHNAYYALDAAGALLRPGLTGTNVMDVVIGIC